MSPLIRRPAGGMRDKYARRAPLVSGETVTSGRFRCCGCGHEHQVPSGRVTNLPVCPRCFGDEWELR